MDGSMSCGAIPQGDGGPPTVLGCVYGVSGACPTASDPATAKALSASHYGSCPAFVLDTMVAPIAETSSDGAPACCYQGGIANCVGGRALTVDGRALTARVVRAAAWSRT
jgi:hypothetical protein